jgi:hypothetical protein
MNLAIYFLALIGLIVVLIIIYRFSTVSMNKIDKSSVVKHWPPKQYMQNVGALCPDYWVYMGPDPNNPNTQHICMNRFNLDIRKVKPEPTTNNPDPIEEIPEKCYTSPNGTNTKQKIFPTMTISDDNKLVDKGKSTQDGLKNICEFIKECGPSNGKEASWLGINTSNGWYICP